MATSKSKDFEEYVKGLLECPGCSESIKLAPMHQCSNGHVICKNCITRLEYCPICENNSTIARNLVFEQIIRNFSSSELANEEPSEKNKPQKWGQGFVCASFSNNGSDEGSSVNLILHPNSDTTKSTEHERSKFEKYIEGLLECPVCFVSIKSTPIHQCANGHIVCKHCISKLKNCPICRNDSTIARNLIFEQIVGNFSEFEVASETPPEKHEHQKWGASFSNNGLNLTLVPNPVWVETFGTRRYGSNEESSVELNLQLETMESVELGGTSNRIRSTLKSLKHKTICVIWTVLKTLGILLLIIVATIVAYDFLLLTLEKIGVDIPEEYFTYDRKTSRYDPGTYLGY